MTFEPRTTARFETRQSDGYERWRTSYRGRDEYCYVHRLAAVAWGILDGLDDERHVHHRVLDEDLGDIQPKSPGVPWLNVEEAFEAVEPDLHGYHHRAQQLATDGGKSDTEER